MFSPGGEPEASSWGRRPLTRGVNGQGWGARRLSGEIAFSARAGLWPEGTEVSSVVRGGKSLQCVMGKKLTEPRARA